MRKDGLWPFYLVTIAYLLFGAVVLYDRWGEVGSLFVSPSAGAAQLPLNSIGDVLAGFFAPLAFLWLFAATQLQRQELRLQREELSDTRSVLSEQRAELERAARESNLQTAIMQRTFETTLSKNQYDEFNLRLYFYCMECQRFGVNRVIFGRPGHGAKDFHMSHLDRTIDQNNPSSIDSFLLYFRDRIKYIAEISAEYDDNLLIFKELNPGLIDLLTYTNEVFNDIERLYGQANGSLVFARIRGLHLDQLGQNCIRLRGKFSATD